MSLSKVQQQLYRDWTASDDAANAKKRSEDLGLIQVAQLRRMSLSYYRRHVYRLFGSSEWLHTIIALGQIPEDYVEILRACCERVREQCRTPGTVHHSREQPRAPAPGNTMDPRQLPRSSRTEPEDGLHHAPSQPKCLRDAAKMLDKRIFHESQRWDIGSSRMGRHEWEELLDTRDKAWDKAEELSMRLGFPFKNRNGEWVNNHRTDLVYLSLVEWCKQHGIVYK